MPIKWSAAKVSEAMDEVEQQVLLADQFIAEAERLTKEALLIPNLPQYMSQRISTLRYRLGETIERLKGDVRSIRNDIPEGAVESERERTKHGSQQGLI